MLMTNRDFATASFVTNGEPSLFAHLAGRSKLRGRSHRPHLVRFLRAGGHIILSDFGIPLRRGSWTNRQLEADPRSRVGLSHRREFPDSMHTSPK
jgi:hypothetical protein